MPETVTCGDCGRSWDDSRITSMTPAPSGRCPFEAFEDGEPVPADWPVQPLPRTRSGKPYTVEPLQPRGGLMASWAPEPIPERPEDPEALAEWFDPAPDDTPALPGLEPAPAPGGGTCGVCLGSGTEARSYGLHQWDIPTCRTCNGSGRV